MAKPIHTIRIKSLKAAIWENTRGDNTFTSVSIAKSYKDGKGNWQETTNFNRDDLPVLILLAQKCYDWLLTEYSVDKTSSGGDSDIPF